MFFVSFARDHRLLEDSKMKFLLAVFIVTFLALPCKNFKITKLNVTPVLYKCGSCSS